VSAPRLPSASWRSLVVPNDGQGPPARLAGSHTPAPAEVLRALKAFFKPGAVALNFRESEVSQTACLTGQSRDRLGRSQHSSDTPLRQRADSPCRRTPCRRPSPKCVSVAGRNGKPDDDFRGGYGRDVRVMLAPSSRRTIAAEVVARSPWSASLFGGADRALCVIVIHDNATPLSARRQQHLVLPIGVRRPRSRSPAPGKLALTAWAGGPTRRPATHRPDFRRPCRQHPIGCGVQDDRSGPGRFAGLASTASL